MNEELWKQARGLTQKLKKQQQDNESIGEKLVGWVVVSVIVFLLAVLFVLPLTIYFVWSYAYVFVKLWAWFVVPVFNLYPLSMAQAWGLMMLSGLVLVSRTEYHGKDERETSVKVIAFIMLFVKPWAALGAGWICAHYFLHLV